jgi:Ca2+-binding EF-hand superfamily protein
MKTIPVSFLIAGMLLPAACLAQAQEPQASSPGEGKARKDGGRRPFSETWKAADKDQDGFISSAEFASMPRIQNLPEEKRAGIFKRLDKDSDGKLGREELGRFGGGPHDGKGPHMKRLWELDADKSGGISLVEFKAGELFKKLPPEKQETVFRRLDTDGDGVITPKDKPQPFKRPKKEDGGPQEKGPDGINRKLDTNGDGALSFEEFRAGPAMKDLSEDAQEERFEALDRNDDLKISPEDFPPQDRKDAE